MKNHRLGAGVLFALVALATVALAGTVSAQATDIIRGRVTGAIMPDTGAIEGVNVKATSYSGGVAKTARTDRGGRFTIIFINGEGDYWLDFTKIGLAPRRFE